MVIIVRFVTRNREMKIDEAIKSKFRSPQHRALINLIYTTNWLNSRKVELLRPYGISPQQYNVLRILRGSNPEPLSVLSIKERMLDKTPNTTRLIDKLLSKKLVSRTRYENDRRVVFVTITDSGIRLMGELDSLIEDNELPIMKWDDDLANQISDALDELRK